MYCRFCGAEVPADSTFCARCGKRLAGEPTGRLVRATHSLRLKTPYPWALVLFSLFVGWVLWPAEPTFDLTTLGFELELQEELSLPDDNLFRQYLSLVVMNRGEEAVRDVPVELQAALSPAEGGEIVSEFRGGRFVLHRGEESFPIVLMLSDEIPAGLRRRFPIDSIVLAPPPREVTYTVAAADSGQPLATLSTRIDLDQGAESP